MIGYLDSDIFYLFYLLLLGGLCVLNVVIFIGCKKNDKVKKLIPLNRYFLLICIVIFILDSIPYLYINIFDIPIINIILSNVFLLLVGLSSIIYEYVDIAEKNALKEIKKSVN